jgi:hypothetical protein
VQLWLKARLYLFLSIVGLVLLGAGYVPIVTIFLPNLDHLASRVNLFASLGSAVFLGSVLMIGSVIFSKDQQQTKYLLIVSAAPFLLLGVLTQTLVQYDTKSAWREQQTIWRELFERAPNFKDNTKILLVLPGYQDRAGYQNWRRTPLDASWEVSSGVQLLYDNHTLSADIVFPDIETLNEPTLTAEGIFTKDTGTLVPYSRAVAFVYDNDREVLEQLDEFPVKSIEGVVGLVKLCADCVLREEVLNVPLRELVQN